MCAARPLKRADPNEAEVHYLPAAAPAPLTGVARGRWTAADRAAWPADRARIDAGLAWRDACGTCDLCRYADAHPGEPSPSPGELADWLEIEADKAELRADPERLGGAIVERGRNAGG